MSIVRAGEPFIDGIDNFPEGVEYNFAGGEHTLIISHAGIRRIEVDAVNTGEPQFGLVPVSEAVLFLTYRFGKDTPWSDASYAWYRVPENERVHPTALQLSETLLKVVMIEASTGIVMAVRPVKFSEGFARELHLAIGRQMLSEPLDESEYEALREKVYGQYPNSDSMLVDAIIVQRGHATDFPSGIAAGLVNRVVGKKIGRRLVAYFQPSPDSHNMLQSVLETGRLPLRGRGNIPTDSLVVLSDPKAPRPAGIITVVTSAENAPGESIVWVSPLYIWELQSGEALQNPGIAIPADVSESLRKIIANYPFHDYRRWFI